MQPRLAAIVARPNRGRADEANAGAGAVEMHFVGRREQRLDIAVHEEIWRAVRAVDHADIPFARQGGWLRRGYHRFGRHLAGKMQHVPRFQRTGGVAAELTKTESRPRAEHDGCCKPPATAR